MDFVRRRLSQGGSSDEEGRSLSSSFSEGTSRFFTSMVAKKNGLINNLSSKLENVMKTASSPEDSDSESVSPAQTPSSNYSSYSNGSRNFRGDDLSTQPYRSNKKTERIGIPRRQSSSGYSDSSGNDEAATGNISFDEPMYSPTSRSAFSYDSKKENLPKSNSIGMKKVENAKQDKVQGSSDVTDNKSESESMSKPDFLKSNAEEMLPQSKSSDEEDDNETETKSKVVSPVEKSEKESNIDINGYKRAPKMKRRSSTVDEMLFDDYVPPPEETEEDNDKFDESEDVNVNSKRKTLIPMGDLISFDDDPENEPETRRKVPLGNDKFSPFTSVSSIDSSECSVGNNQNDSTSESEYGGFPIKRSYSIGSENSWSSSFSIESQPDEQTLLCMEFMKGFVDQIFDTSKEISQTDKAKFGKLCQEAAGRQWFARYVNGQRVSNKRVTEQIFFRLMQYFAVVLFECGEAEDFTPAKSLMNMCFTFYYEGCHGKNFLYSFLREQPIWQSLRFWNAAFFDAVQLERSKRPVCTSDDGDDLQKDDRQFQENITFGQLGTFTCNMRAFGLSKELCSEFLRKQSTIANLKKEQVQMLKDNVDKWCES